MSIEFEITSVQLVDQQELQEYLPSLGLMINSSMPIKKKLKRRRRKTKKTIGPMIQDIIDSIE